MDRAAISRSRLAAQVAPGIAAWAFLAWIVAAHALPSKGCWHILRCLWLVQVGVIVLSVVGGVAALSLPSRLLRIGVAAGSLSGAVLLYGAFLAVVFGPGF